MGGRARGEARERTLRRPCRWTSLADKQYEKCVLEKRMKTTRCFDEQVRRKRPYVDSDWRARIIVDPLRREEQSDGRVRFWGEVLRPGDDAPRILRVVTLADEETIHNAFFDRGFQKDKP